MNKSISNLNGLKVFMSIHIALAHTFPTIHRGDVSRLIFEYASISTSMFIILSGFFLACFYHEKEVRVIPFVKKRIQKLYPFHVFMVLFSAIIMLEAVFRHDYKVQMFSNFIFLDGWEYLIAIISQILLIDSLNPFFPGINVPAWTLSTLFFCYSSFPFFTKKIKNLSLGCLLSLLFALVLIVNTISFTAFNFGVNDEYLDSNVELYAWPNMIGGLFHRFPIMRLPEFLLGIILFFVFKKMEGKNNFPILFLLLGVSYLVVVLYLAYPIDYIIYHNGIFLPFELLIIYSFCSFKEINFFSLSLITKIGVASFIIYLFHMPWFIFMSKLAKGLVWGIAKFFYGSEILDPISYAKEMINNSLLFFILYFVSMIMLSVYIEIKWRPYLKGVWVKKS
ncbi:MAG: acyltransferase family protein [Breznakibacter sp.]